jgi:tetratricopeptide (TPR) repeat protein
MGIQEFLVHIKPYFSWQYGKVALMLLLVLWVVRYLSGRTKFGDSIRKQGQALLTPALKPLKDQFEAQRAEKTGDWVEAGNLYEQAGKLEQALDCFEKGEAYERCGEICVRMGRKDYAAEWFLFAGEKKKAAALFGETGRFDKAAEAYLEAGSTLDAASAFTRAGNHVQAAEIYLAGDNFVRAGEAFERAGEYLRAAESFTRQVKESGGSDSQYLGGGQQAELNRLCLQAARLFEKAGELEKAVQVLEVGGHPGQAAELAVKLGQDRRAAELFQKSGQAQKAAEMYARAGDEQTAASLKGDQQLAEGNAQAAAESFLKSGDPVRAAEIFEGIGLFERAAECYAALDGFAPAAEAMLRAGCKERAASYFEKAKQFDRAGELYFDLGVFDRAAELFAQTERFFDAAKASAEANSEKQMVDYLQRVPSNDTNYLAAVEQIARIFIGRGWGSLAIEKLKSVLGEKPVLPDNLDLNDMLARAHEAEGNLTDAADLLHRMMAVQYSYRDIRQRHKKLQDQLEEQKLRLSTLRGAKRADMSALGTTNGKRYAVEDLLGKGGMGSVYKAYDRLLKRSVAYKVLAERFARDPKARDQLLAEARAAAALNHPNIITVFDIGVDGKQAFICMELIEGESYSALLRKKKRLEIAEVLHLLVSTCQGLDHAHQKGIVHRDLKPSNLLLTVENRVKIVDFGLAQPMVLSGDGGQTGGSSLSGTPRFIAPEQARGEATDARSDIYSLGASLYNVLVGHPPFTTGNVIMHHLNTPAPPLRPERPEIPQALEEIVLLCLAKHPQERYQSAGEIISHAAAAKLL